MENNKLIGRKNEREQFDDIYATKKPALVAVYGRRRVGKTFLVRQHFNNNFDFSFTNNCANTCRRLTMNGLSSFLTNYRGWKRRNRISSKRFPTFGILGPPRAKA